VCDGIYKCFFVTGGGGGSVYIETNRISGAGSGSVSAQGGKGGRPTYYNRNWYCLESVDFHILDAVVHAWSTATIGLRLPCSVWFHVPEVVVK
jgi:hypothetical protein